MKITADIIYDGTGNELKDSVIILENSKILDIVSLNNFADRSGIKYYDGAITPGFINTHCHLELSHMQGLVDTGTTLLPFLKKVVTYRDFEQRIIDQSIVDADREMYGNGIVAVGDISNKIDTAGVKASSPINYYTFVEMFDFQQPAMTQPTIDQYTGVYEGHSTHNGNRKSFVPHAPYTVSEGLFTFINSSNPNDCTVSIHNQETPAENELFEKGTGEFLDFFQNFGFDTSVYQPQGTKSLAYSINHMNPENHTIFVHNTMTENDDIVLAHRWSPHTYWATCPNANLYIENRLPRYDTFIKNEAKMTIGTDSLSSNWSLNIASEILTIQKYCSYIPLSTLINWASLNGAQALGYDDTLGSIEIGKSPGLNHIHIHKYRDKTYLSSDKVTKIV